MSNFIVLRLSHARRSKPARGIVIIAVLVILAIAMALLGIWTHRIISEQHRLQMEQYRIQATRLAEAGVRRAVVMRAGDAKFEQETWSVPASELDQTHTAEVQILVDAVGKEGALRYLATAKFPADSIHRAQITKLIEIPSSIPKDRS